MDINTITNSLSNKNIGVTSLNTKLDEASKSKVDFLVDKFNKTLGRNTSKKELGKDDFLKILVTQLQNQDPSSPMKDKEMISQLAQMSSLEQMNNLRSDFKSVASAVSSSNANSLLGKMVELKDQNGTPVTGVVDEVVKGEFPQVYVRGKYYDQGFIIKVINNKNDTLNSISNKNDTEKIQ